MGWWQLAAVLAAAVLALPALPIAAFRWIAPPTSAYMLRSEVVDYRWTPWEAIAPALPLAIVASEDQRFFEHRGFDLASIQAAVAERHRGGRLRGASTLSQQVAKNLFLWPGRSFLRKGLEAYLTVWIEALWSKRRILEIYLNIAEFGPGIFGVGAAASRFFDTSPADLTPREAALLAAVLPNPNRLHADNPSHFVEERVAWIQSQMRKLGEATRTNH